MITKPVNCESNKGIGRNRGQVKSDIANSVHRIYFEINL